MKVLLNAVSAKMGGAVNSVRNIASELEISPLNWKEWRLRTNSLLWYLRIRPERSSARPQLFGSLPCKVLDSWDEYGSINLCYAGCWGMSELMCCTRPQIWECSRVPTRKWHWSEIPCIFLPCSCSTSSHAWVCVHERTTALALQSLHF